MVEEESRLRSRNLHRIAPHLQIAQQIEAAVDLEDVGKQVRNENETTRFHLVVDGAGTSTTRAQAAVAPTATLAVVHRLRRLLVEVETRRWMNRSILPPKKSPRNYY